MKTRETMRTREEINSPMLMEREAAKYLRINNSTLVELRINEAILSQLN